MGKDYKTEDTSVREQELEKLMNKISRRLIQARDENGMTQAQMAGFAGLSRKTIVMYEAGQCDMTIPTLFRILRAADMEMVDLFQ